MCKNHDVPQVESWEVKGNLFQNKELLFNNLVDKFNNNNNNNS